MYHIHFCGRVPFSENIDFEKFKPVMLAALRSLLPKQWSTLHENAWEWLWMTVARNLNESTMKVGKDENKKSCRKGRFWATFVMAFVGVLNRWSTTTTTTTTKLNVENVDKKGHREKMVRFSGWHQDISGLHQHAKYSSMFAAKTTGTRSGAGVQALQWAFVLLIDWRASRSSELQNLRWVTSCHIHVGPEELDGPQNALMLCLGLPVYALVRPNKIGTVEASAFDVKTYFNIF